MYDFSSCKWYYRCFSSVFPIVPACTRIVKMCKLKSTQNLPPTEANKRKEKFSGDYLSPRQGPPDPGRGSRPSALSLYEWISEKRAINIKVDSRQKRLLEGR